MFQSQFKVDHKAEKEIVTIENLPVAEKTKPWSSTDEGKYFVAATNNGGVGSDGNKVNKVNESKDNPWSKGGGNFTKQNEIQNTESTRAAQLKAAVVYNKNLRPLIETFFPFFEPFLIINVAVFVASY